MEIPGKYHGISCLFIIIIFTLTAVFIRLYHP